MALTRGELARKVVHMGVGTIAFSLRFLGPLWAAILAAGALGFNLFLLPRIGGRKLWRRARGGAPAPRSASSSIRSPCCC